MSDGNLAKKVAILDAGAQYTKLIDKMVRSFGIESIILPLDTDEKTLENYGAVIISGGPDSVNSPTVPKYDPNLFRLNRPVLGICYGLQMMNFDAGGTVASKDIREDGQFEIQVDVASPLFAGLSPQEKVLLTHGDSLEDVAEGYQVIARSGQIVAGIQNLAKKYFGVQFHPEVGRLTPAGRQIFRNFLFDIAGLEASLTLQNRQEEILEEIRQTVGDKKVIVLVSGGVDSSVCAALMTKALKPKQIEAFHIDTGLMRQNESDLVKEALEKIGLKIHLIRAANDFLNGQTEINGSLTLPLKETVSPEEKRKIIGDTYIKVIDREVSKLGLNFEDTILVQGTLRPDLIESASQSVSKTADTIKTHHNDTALVRALRDAGRVVEPLKDLHKDEVRQLGASLGLPEELVWRQPFPGPGLAVRVLCYTMEIQNDELEAKPNSPLLRGTSPSGDRGLMARMNKIPPSPQQTTLSASVSTGNPKTNAQIPPNSLERGSDTLHSSKNFDLPSNPSSLEGGGLAAGRRMSGSQTNTGDVVQQNPSLFTIGSPLRKTEAQIKTEILPEHINCRLLPIKTVGVQGDGRTYKNVATLFALRPDWAQLYRLATEIPKKFHDINRVVYAFGDYNEQEYGLTETMLDTECLDQLRQADDVVNQILLREQLIKNVSQMPVILTPVDFGQTGARSIVLRPIITDDFMTGVPALPGQEIPILAIQEMVAKIKQVSGISVVMYDLTSKPPGTTEWE